MQKFLLVAVVLSLLQPLSLAGSESEPSEMEAGPATTPIPLVAWWSIPFSHATEERYREMADAGFTHCLPPDRGPEENRLHLELAGRVGVQVIVQDRRLKDDAVTVVQDYKDFPALAAYHLKDEPGASEFAELGTLANQLRTLDPAHPSYINLLPTYAEKKLLGTEDYDSYLKQFCTAVRPAFLSYDNYLISGNSHREREFFRNLWTMRAKAAKHRIPFWAFVMATAHGPYPEPGEGDLRFQAFSSLAYGARGIQYFTYWTPTGRPDHLFRGGPIDENGDRTAVYQHAKKVNSDIQALAPKLASLVSTGVHLTAPLPDGEGTALHSGGLPETVTAVGGDSVVLGTFEDGKKHRFLLIVNRSPENPASVSLKFSPDVKNVTEVPKPSTDHQEPLTMNDHHVLALHLSPGDGRLLRLH